MYFRLEKKEAQKKKKEYQLKIILMVNPKIRDVKNSLPCVGNSSSALLLVFTGHH